MSIKSKTVNIKFNGTTAKARAKGSCNVFFVFFFKLIQRLGTENIFTNHMGISKMLMKYFQIFHNKCFP